MENSLPKRGPAKQHNFADYPVGHEVKIVPLKQSSFKSMLSTFNKSLAKEERHVYDYEQQKNFIIGRRVK